ncbi:hypothetical protein ElyMa_005554400 [Elysia marginata]|uniref:Uncharacterized protein n=1 Tax=Elysia marginata TaxID=1093978 RepID=A0AAV4EZU7_9GAST|nr:hypothetical protein ElyMa_005554400 [Elysia marginata]
MPTSSQALNRLRSDFCANHTRYDPGCEGEHLDVLQVANGVTWTCATPSLAPDHVSLMTQGDCPQLDKERSQDVGSEHGADDESEQTISDRHPSIVVPTERVVGEVVDPQSLATERSLYARRGQDNMNKSMREARETEIHRTERDQARAADHQASKTVPVASGYGVGSSAAVYKPLLPGFYSHSNVSRHGNRQPGNMTRGDDGDAEENVVHVSDHTSPLLDRYGSRLVRRLNSSDKGACGVLTLNTCTGRHEWKLLERRQGGSSVKGCLRGGRRKSSTRPVKQTLPSGLWISPYQKMERERDESELSRLRSLPSIFDLTLRVGKGIGVSGGLGVCGQHINLRGSERGSRDAAPLPPPPLEQRQFERLPEIPTVEVHIPPLDLGKDELTSNALDDLSSQATDADFCRGSDIDDQEFERFPATPTSIVVPRIVFEKACLNAGVDHNDATEPNKDVTGAREAQASNCQTARSIYATTNNSCVDIFGELPGKGAGDILAEKEEQDAAATENRRTKLHLEVPSVEMEGQSVGGSEEEGQTAEYDGNEDGKTCHGKSSARTPRAEDGNQVHTYRHWTNQGFAARGNSPVCGWRRLDSAHESRVILEAQGLTDMPFKDSERPGLEHSTEHLSG